VGANNGNQFKPEIMTKDELHQSVFELVQKYLSKESRVLDLGAGQGAFSKRLKAIGHDVLAVDGDRENWRLPEVEFQTVDLDLEFAPLIKGVGFDAIVAIEIIEHLENPFSFIRQCAKLLKKDGILFVTTPNVEAINSRVLFLIKGRLNYFDENATLRPAHITPVFNWKLDMALEEANFDKIHDEYISQIYTLGTHNLKGRIGGILSKIVYPFVKGEKYGENRIVVARLNRE
jgi:2-polyprenyl-3-methyl-5-hydroxy-6-metoxy-1,4-benzoquinol methylase